MKSWQFYYIARPLGTLLFWPIVGCILYVKFCDNGESYRNKQHEENKTCQTDCEAANDFCDKVEVCVDGKQPSWKRCLDKDGLSYKGSYVKRESIGLKAESAGYCENELTLCKSRCQEVYGPR